MHKLAGAGTGHRLEECSLHDTMTLSLYKDCYLLTLILQHLANIPRRSLPKSVPCCLNPTALTQQPEHACVCAQQHAEGGHQHSRLWGLITPHLQEGFGFGAKLAAAGGKVDVALNCHQVFFMVAPNAAGVIHQ